MNLSRFKTSCNWKKAYFEVRSLRMNLAGQTASFCIPALMVVAWLVMCVSRTDSTMVPRQSHHNCSGPSSPSLDDFGGSGANYSSSVCPTLYLLNVVPVPDSRVNPESWDEGYEVIPAGLLAVRHINERDDILKDYTLQMIDIEAEPCGVSPVTKGLVNFYHNLTNFFNQTHSHCIVGVVGLYCSSLTQTIAPLVNHSQVNYVAIAASTASSHHDPKLYPRLFHIIATFSVVENAVISMMKRFSWSRIGLIYDDDGLFFYSSAIAFSKTIVQDPNLELAIRFPLDERNITETFASLIQSEVRISFWSVSAEQAASIMCEAYSKQLFWESYVHIFHGHTVREILNANTSCTPNELLKAIDGIFLLNYDLSADSNESHILVSNITYNQYKHEYMEELKEYSAARGLDNRTTPSEWASSLYDQIWAFAMALNGTVDSIGKNAFSPHCFGGSESESLSEVIAKELKMLSFEGASGHIEFGEQHEVQTSVSIIRVRNGMEEIVGEFHPYVSNESMIWLSIDEVPKDRFETKYTLVPFPIAIVAFSLQCVLFVITTSNLVLFIFWRNKTPIKATSPNLSLLIFVGCYFLCFAPVAQTVGKSVRISNEKHFVALCHVENWLLFNGMNLILATLLFCLLRIYYVFRVFRKTTKYFSDQFLFLYILLTCLFEVLILSVWSIFSSFRRITEVEYISKPHPPFYRVTETCTSNEIDTLLSLSYFYSGVLLIMVVFLAVQTRHIQKEAFKDTKKVNVFVFTVVAIIAVATPLQHHFSNIGSITLEYIFKWLACFSVPLLCQLLLFSTKTLPLLLRQWKNRCRGKDARNTGPAGFINPLTQVTVIAKRPD